MAKPRPSPQLSLRSAHVEDDLGGIPANHWSYAFFTHIRCAFSDGQFADLYEERGRSPISPALLACITLLQAMFPCGVRTAVANVVMRRDWRIALGIPAGWEPFDHTVLWRFQQRLVESDGGMRLFATVLERARELGLLSQTRAVRIDATHLLAAAGALSRAEALQEALRLAVCQAGERAAQLHEDGQFQTLYEAYHSGSWLGCERGGQRTLRELGRDGYVLLAVCQGLECEALTVLERMLGEQFVVVEGEAPEPLQLEALASGRLYTPHEQDVGMGRKGSKTWLGSKVHIIEGCGGGQDETEADASGAQADEASAREQRAQASERPAPSLIVGVLVTEAQAEDSTQLGALLEVAQSAVPELEMVLTDGGYASGANAELAQGRGIELICPPRQDTSGMAVPASAFAIDFAVQEAICPQGHRQVVWSVSRTRPTVNIRFDGKTCQGCALWGECTSSPQGRTVCVSAHYPALERSRARAREPWYWRVYRRRAGIEGTMSRLVRCCGLRRSRGYGEGRRKQHAVVAATGHNVRQLLGWLTAT